MSGGWKLGSGEVLVTRSRLEAYFYCLYINFEISIECLGLGPGVLKPPFIEFKKQPNWLSLSH